MNGNPMESSWRLLKNAGGEEPFAYHGGSPPQAEAIYSPDDARRAPSEFDPNSRKISQLQQWMGKKGLSLDNLSEWEAPHLDIAQMHSPTAEMHQLISDERARRGYNIIPKDSMIDVGRDPIKNPMPSNRTDSDYYDSVRGDFMGSGRDFQQKNAGEAMAMSWRLLKQQLTPEQEQMIQQMTDAGDVTNANALRRAYEQTNAAQQAAREGQPQMTPQIQANYQDPLNLKREKTEAGQAIRRLMSGGRLNSKELKVAMHEYRERYGEDPPRTPKSLRRRL